MITDRILYSQSIITGNNDAYGRRLKIADDCLEDMVDWLQQKGGQVGIYDGNNITEDRRKEVYDRLMAEDIHVMKEIIIITCYTYLMQYFLLGSFH